MSHHEDNDWVGALGLLGGLGLVVAGMYGAWQGILSVATLILLATALVVSFIPLYYAVQVVVGAGPPVSTGLVFLASRWGIVALLSLGLHFLFILLALGRAGQFVASVAEFFAWFGISAFLAKSMWCETMWEGLKISAVESVFTACFLGILLLLSIVLGPFVSIGTAVVGFLAFWFMGYE